MKVGPAEARRFAAAPPRGLRGALLFGEDESLAAELRRALAAALVGPDGAAEMRLDELPAARLRADPGALELALRAQGFFAGRRAVVVTDATDAHADRLTAALADAATPEAALIVTAGALKAKSALRRLFEDGRDTAALEAALVAPDRAQLAAMAEAAGAGALDRDGLDALEAASEGLSRGEIARFVETLALWRDDDAAVSAAAVEALAPAGRAGAVDDAVAAAAEGDAAGFRRAAARLAAEGTSPTTLAITAARHFRALHALAVADRPEVAAQRMRPPLWGARRDAMIRQARRWGAPRLERALRQLHAVDLELRSGGGAPARALLERTLLRLALSGER
jgi:DNA polymerase-3 subunit delta